MHSNRPIFQSFDRIQSRLVSPFGLFPFPALISFFLVMLLLKHTTLALNEKLGNPAEVVIFDAESPVPGSIWLSLSIENDDLVVFFNSKSILRFNTSRLSDEALMPLSAHFKKLKMENVIAAGLSMESAFETTFVTIAVDQRVKYYHVKPVIKALADAGFTNYGFETKIYKDQLRE